MSSAVYAVANPEESGNNPETIREQSGNNPGTNTIRNKLD
tara:strand:- start:691 stop:810 length:120 start_codon:yes stop_codon:yes gene_type:complete